MFTALKKTVVECLDGLRFTESFWDALTDKSTEKILSLLNSTDTNETFTLFVPNNGAFRHAHKKHETLNYESLLTTHIVRGLVRNSDLCSYSRLKSLNDKTQLQVTEIPFYTSDGDFFEVSILHNIYVLNT